MIEASIIVPTRNRAPWLAQALKSFTVQDFPSKRYEIIVVDNGSTDETAEVARSAIREFPDRCIRYVAEPVPGLLSGRHRGAAESKGDLLLYVDDDIEAAPGWLSSVVDAFADPAVHLVGGPCIPKFEVDPPPWMDNYWVRSGHRIECSALSLIYMGDTAKWVDPDFVWGLNYAIRKSTFHGAGGFHPDCIPSQLQHFQGDGESGLSLKVKQMGFAAAYVPGARVVHHIPMQRLTVSYFEKRNFYQGVCESYTQIRKNRSVRGCRFRPYPELPEAAAEGSAYGKYQKIIHRRLQQAHRAGFDFHQEAVAKSGTLLQWVLKKDYFDYRLPGLNSGQAGLPTRAGTDRPHPVTEESTGDRVDTAHPLRPTMERALTPKIAQQLRDFERSPPERRQSSMERSQKPMANLAYFAKLRNRLEAAGITVQDAAIDRADFDQWRSLFPEITAFYRPAGEVFIEKCLEHYLVFRHLGLTKEEIYIDVAAAHSPWADALQRLGVASYRMDLIYPPGVHGMNIGADAGDTGLPEGFCTAMSLQCAFECFMGDADQRFVREASRILAPGGRLAVTPLYLEDTHFITTSPMIDQDKVILDPGARRVWRDDAYMEEPFCRMYSPEAFAQRIWQHLPEDFRATVVFFSNLGEVMSHYKGQRIYCFFMLLAEKSAVFETGGNRCRQ